jgi:hypothetical protein
VADDLKPAALADLLRKKPPTKDLRIEIEGEGYRLRLQGIARPDFDALVNAHEAPDKTKLAWNPDTFPAALVAACLVDPALTVDEVEGLFATWTKADCETLFVEAFDLCNQSSIGALGKG